jgi:uncharacterized protein
MNGKNPLDSSAVHPESYVVVKAISAANNKPVDAIIGNSDFLRNLKAIDYTDAHFGLPTVTDIISELDKPGRDPRPEFKTATFAEGVNEVKDLIPGMVLEGVITNVTNFGAFVDVGVHQDGLIHISALSDKFISDPREVVKAGDVVKVKVMEVDIQRKRIAMTMRLSDEPGQEKPSRQSTSAAVPRQQPARQQPRQNSAPAPQKNTPPMGGAFAAAFANAKKK